MTKPGAMGLEKDGEKDKEKEEKVMVFTRISPQVKAKIMKVAGVHGLNLAEYLQDLITKELERQAT